MPVTDRLVKLSRHICQEQTAKKTKKTKKTKEEDILDPEGGKTIKMGRLNVGVGAGTSLSLSLPTDYSPPLPTPLEAEGGYENKGDVLLEAVDSRLNGYEHLSIGKWAEMTDSGKGPETYWVPMARPDMTTDNDDPSQLDTFAQVNVVDPEDAKRIVQNHVQKPFMYSQGFIGKGVLGQQNNVEWWKQRQQLRPAFSGKSLSKLQPVMNDECLLLLAKLKHAAESGEAVNLHEEFHHSAFMVLGQSALGGDSTWLEENAKNLQRAFSLGRHKNYEQTPEGKIADGHLRAFTAQVFAEGAGGKTSASVDPNSLQSRLSGSVYGKDKELQHDELMNFMFAGHDTTANTMAWMVYELARHPDVARKLQADIDAALRKREGGADAPLEYRDVHKSKYLARVVNEVLRLWNVVPKGPRREFQFDETLAGPGGAPVTVRKGTVFSVPHWVIHRDPKHWGEDALEFKPEREWNDKAFMPFTYPPRDCIGRNFALMEIKTFMIKMLSNFDFHLVDPSDTKMGDTTDGTLGTERGLHVKVTFRENAPAGALAREYHGATAAA